MIIQKEEKDAAELTFKPKIIKKRNQSQLDWDQKSDNKSS